LTRCSIFVFHNVKMLFQQAKFSRFIPSPRTQKGATARQAAAKARPGQISYASAGNGSMHHLGTELLKSRTGMDMLHVPYRGTGATIGDPIAGPVPV